MRCTGFLRGFRACLDLGLDGGEAGAKVIDRAVHRQRT